MSLVFATCRLASGLIAVVCLALASMTVPAAQSCPCGEVKLLTQVNESDYTPKIGLSYARTPQYKKEFDDAISGACATLSKHQGEKNLAVVSDIDETLLDNMPFFEKHEEEVEWKDFFAWVDESKAPSLKKTADMLAQARKQGLAIFLVTGRMEKLRKGTIDNLVRNGIAYDGLYMRSNGDKAEAAEYKSAVRRQIEEMGYKIVLNIGDQFSDLAGGSSEDCQKLPNKIYYIP